MPALRLGRMRSWHASTRPLAHTSLSRHTIFSYTTQTSVMVRRGVRSTDLSNPATQLSSTAPVAKPAIYPVGETWIPPHAPGIVPRPVGDGHATSAPFVSMTACLMCAWDVYAPTQITQP